MDLLFEILVEFLLEGTIEISKNKKVPKMIRYPLITLIVVLFTGVIFLIFLIGVLAYQRTSKIVGLFFILIGILFLIASIVKFYKVYLKKKRSNNNL